MPRMIRPRISSGLEEKPKKGRPKVIKARLPESDELTLIEIVEPTVTKPDLVEPEEESLIGKELKKFEEQIAEIQDAIASIKLKEIEDPEALLKAINGKIAAQLKLPQLLTALEDLKNKQKVRSDAIKGNKSFSPLEDGTLDDEED